MIAIDMKMPKNCVECRFGQSECGFCHAATANFVGYVYQSKDEGRPDWCPLLQVDKVMSEKIIDHTAKLTNRKAMNTIVVSVLDKGAK